MTLISTDLCVIGAGSGGLSVAAGAVQMGARVVLIEAGTMGGDCLNTGCVPSKALLAAAKAADARRRGFPGLAPVKPNIDFAGVKDHVARVIATIAPHDSQERFEGLGCTVIRAFARFVSPREVEAGETLVRARRFVIATGSRPFIPAIPGIDSTPYLTNETIFSLQERPEHLVIIGGGPVGLEMAQAHVRLGAKVTVVEAARILGHEDAELAAHLADALRAEGITILEGQTILSIEGREGAIKLGLADGRVIEGSHVLIAAGRRAALIGLGLEKAKVNFTPKGISVDDRLQSSNRRIYAVGDAAGGPHFTHVAGWHAGIVIRRAVLGLPARARSRAIPRVTFTGPELAHVGLTETEALARYGKSLSVHRSPYSQNDRAQAEGQTTGMIKLLVVRGRPVGVSILGAHAGELIGLWALAISARLGLSDMSATILPYPTLGEVSKRAVSAYFSPKLFANPVLRGFVRLVQRLIP